MTTDQSPPNLRNNVISSLIGNGWLTAMQLLLTPIFLSRLGIEAYGLFGFYLALQAMAQIFDFGLGTTLNRELARHSARGGSGAEIRDFARTLEAGGWATAIMAAAVIFCLAPSIVNRWTQVEHLSGKALGRVAFCFSLLIMFQILIRFYQGGLSGLQRLPLQNGIQVLMITLRDGGAMIVLIRISPTIDAFFMWMAAAGLLYVLTLAAALRRSLPPAERPPRIVWLLLRDRSRFVAGLSAITLLGLLVTQLDKVVLSRILSLETYGYYILAATVAGGLSILTISLFNAVFPHFSTLVARGDRDLLRSEYHFYTQLMALMALPVALTIFQSSFDLLHFWTGSTDTATQVAPILRVLMLAAALNNLMFIPFAMQLAHGSTGIAIRLQVIQLAFFAPALVLLSLRLGAWGAAWALAAGNCLNMLLGIFMTHRRLLRGEGWRWLLLDTGMPALAALFSLSLWRRMAPDHSRGPVRFVVSAAALFIILSMAVLLTAPRLRTRLKWFYRGFSGGHNR